MVEFPESVVVGDVSVEVEYRFAPDEPGDGATLRVPLAVLPQLQRADVQSAVPGFEAPRTEALLRSLPKDARRSLIPIPAAAREFVEAMRRAPTGSLQLEEWLQVARGIPQSLLRFQAEAIPAYMNTQVAVIDGERELARGADLKSLRVACAAAANARISEIARDMFGTSAWRRFELEQLPDSVRLAVGRGFVTLYPTLGVQQDGLRVELQWTTEEASLRWLDSAVHLAWSMLESQVRALAKTITTSGPLILSASPYLASRELNDTAIYLAVRQACFADEEAPRTRAPFVEAVDRARERLPQALDESLAAIAGWMTEAAMVRRALDDPRVAASREAAEESREHLHGLLSVDCIIGASPQWLRQLPRYLKAEQRRWQRNTGRGVESPQILQQIRTFTSRQRNMQRQINAQGRISRALKDFRFWLEELRVSLYAQELKTLAPISAVRLEQRAAEIEAWLTR